MRRLLPIVGQEIRDLFSRLRREDIVEMADEHWESTPVFSIQRGREERLMLHVGPEEWVFHYPMELHGKPALEVYFIAGSEREVQDRFAVHEVMLL